MNLLLYAESRQALSRNSGETNPSVVPHTYFLDPAAYLPDSLFEELGYFGALDEEESVSLDSEDSLDELLRWISEPSLTF